jgi:hypothetical protein
MEMFGPVELPKRTKLPTEPDFERRAVTKPGQAQKPEARAGGARLLLGGGGGPDSWQRWGGKPDYEKVWQMQQPVLPRGKRETHGGARRLAGGCGGMAKCSSSSSTAAAVPVVAHASSTSPSQHSSKVWHRTAVILWQRVLCCVDALVTLQPH